MAKNKKSDKPKHVSIYYEQILYDLEFMSDEQAGKLLKMLVWYAMGDKRSLEQLEKMKKAIGVLPPHERGWITSVYQRLFNCIDADLEQYKEKCEKQRQRIQNYWDERKRETTERETNAYHGIPRNTTEEEVTLKGKKNEEGNSTEYHGMPWNTIYDNDNDPITNSNSIRSPKGENNIWEEEEDACAREGKTEAPAIKTGDFMKIWNASVAKARKTSDTTAMKTLSEKDMPPDAEQRIDRVVKQIEQTLSEQDIGKVAEVAKLSPQQAQDRLVVTKWYLVIAMDRYSKVRMKPRDSSFGSFNWFVNEPDRIRKLFNGDIQ